jgi:hypothetical protein
MKQEKQEQKHEKCKIRIQWGECTIQWLKRSRKYTPYESIQDSLQ